MTGRTLKRVGHDIATSEVLRTLREQDTLSRSRLAERLPVSRATISGIIAELIEAGLVEEIGTGQSTGGRRPIRLRFRPESRTVAGVVLFDSHVHAVLTDLAGRPIRFVELALESAAPERMLALMQEAVEQVIGDVPRSQVLGVGVGVPGLVDRETGVIRISVSLGWLQGATDVKGYLERALGLPVYVANRSRVAALGENQVGVAQQVDNSIYIFLGQGIAAGIVLDGQLYLGPNSAAGEIGHVSVDPEGPLCACGNRGCLEVYVAQAALLARARLLSRDTPDGYLSRAVAGELEQLTVDHLIEGARANDPDALRVMTEAGTRIGMACSVLIDLFNPEMVVIGGPLGCAAGDLLLGPIVKEARRRTVTYAFNSTQIVAGTLGTDAAAIGAAVLAINHTPVQLLLGTAP